MAPISIDELSPQMRLPGRLEPIGALGLPQKALLMRCGFEMAERGGLFFEGTTSAAFRLRERLWEYTQSPDTSRLQRAKTWRMEFTVGVKGRGPLRAGHEVVMAQKPYENGWLQYAAFKNFRKGSSERRKLKVPDTEVLRKSGIESPIEWLESRGKFDPWQSNARYVAGFSLPNGFLSLRQRNSGSDFVVGICPNFEDLSHQLLGVKEIQRLLDRTRRGWIVFWNHSKVKTMLRLHPDVIDECEYLMLISVRQSLAGPWHAPSTWLNQPVWKLARLIYLNHLNARNRSVVNLRRATGVIDENSQFTVDAADRWLIRKRRKGER